MIHGLQAKQLMSQQCTAGIINLPAIPGWRPPRRCLNPNAVNQRPAGQRGTWHSVCTAAGPSPEEELEVHVVTWQAVVLLRCTFWMDTMSPEYNLGRKRHCRVGLDKWNGLLLCVRSSAGSLTSNSLKLPCVFNICLMNHNNGAFEDTEPVE